MSHITFNIALIIAILWTTVPGAQAQPPVILQDNVYLLSGIPPSQALAQGFPQSALSDNVQDFITGTPPTFDPRGRPAFYLAFSNFQTAVEAVRQRSRSEPIYLYAIAGDFEWYAADMTIRAIANSLAYRLIAREANQLNLRLRRELIEPDRISYSIEYIFGRGVRLWVNNPTNGYLHPGRIYPPTNEQRYIPSRGLHVVRGSEQRLIAFNTECNMVGLHLLSAALVSIKPENCNAFNIKTVSENEYVAYRILPALFDTADD